MIEIAEKYFCDPRTVKSCIVYNKPSDRLGKQSVPTRLSPYCGYIDDYLTKPETIQTLQQSRLNISALTRDIFHILQVHGYTGCERTVRNYVCSKLPSRKVQKKRRN